jgi:hypothetical protein
MEGVIATPGHHLEGPMWKLLKFAAFVRAPKAMFVLRHPILALKWGAALYVGKKLYQRVRDWSERSEGGELPSPR